MALKDITLGQYFPGHSLVHRLDPRTKILAVVIYIVALFLAKSFVTYAIMFALLALSVKVSTVPVKSLVRGMKPVVFIVIFTAILNLFYTPGDTVLVLGAGPTGLCTMMCARLYRPAHILAVEPDPARRALALAQGWADEAVEPGPHAAEVLRSWTDGRGADVVLEAAGGRDTFQTAWQLARPNATVTVVAMYEEPQVLPLPDMYGKNLTFKTGGVDACHCGEILELIAAGKLNAEPLITHTYPLERVMEAYDLFEQKGDGVLKIAVQP